MKSNKCFDAHIYKKFSLRNTLFLLLFYVCLNSSLNAETIVFSADSMSGTVSDEVDYTRLFGNAYVETESIDLLADSIELNGQDYRYIVASGNISGNYSEAGFTFSCDAITYDREEKIAILEGNVSMFDIENDVDLKAEFIEYNQNTEVALVQVGIEIIKDDSVCNATFAVYRKSIQILELSGSPKITQGEDVFQSHEIVFNLDTEEITLIGSVQGTVTDTEDDDENSETISDANSDIDVQGNSPEDESADMSITEDMESDAVVEIIEESEIFDK